MTNKKNSSLDQFPGKDFLACSPPVKASSVKAKRKTLHQTPLTVYSFKPTLNDLINSPFQPVLTSKMVTPERRNGSQLKSGNQLPNFYVTPNRLAVGATRYSENEEAKATKTEVVSPAKAERELEYDKNRRYFQMGIAYHSLSRALRAKGWIEVKKKDGPYGASLISQSVLNSSGTCSPTRRFMSSTHREIESMLDLKFVLNTQDMHAHNLKTGCFIN